MRTGKPKDKETKGRGRVPIKVGRRPKRRKTAGGHSPSYLRQQSHEKSTNGVLSIKDGEERTAAQEKNVICILCCENKPVTMFSDEHVFPEAIGGKLILKDTVCTSCNGHYIDPADSHLVKHVVIKLDRLVCQIKGASAKRPNPLETSHTDGKENHKDKDTLKDAGGPELRATVEKIEKPTAKNDQPFSGAVNSRVTDKLEKIAQSIGQWLEKANADRELEKVQVPEGIRVNSDIRVPTTFDVVKYKKGILKIAYELACYWLGKPYMDDPTGHRMRQALKDQRDMS